ncbi:RNA-directed DNA polymerase, eukaryota, partial [Tanacetum coccineum]
ATRTGGSLLTVMDELIKVEQTMGYNMDGCLTQKAKKDWVKELCVSNKVNFLTLQETKMESIELFDIKRCWGNFVFDYVYSNSVGSSGGILCVWDTNSFKKLNATISDYFIMIREKKMLWDYLGHVIDSWKGEVIITGDFNEVRYKNERFGSNFNVQGATAFNSFIVNAGLEEVSLGGCAFTWCHKSASKMSKLDRFLISESLLSVCPNFSAITLDRFLSDHRPILLRESTYDYGPISFRFFHYWLEVDGFEKLVIDVWHDTSADGPNDMLNLMNKLKNLQKKIRVWNGTRQSFRNSKHSLQLELADLEMVIDKGNASDDIIYKRLEIVKSIQELDKQQSMEMAQKAKIKWAIEGDENSKYYHGIINKKRNHLFIRGVLEAGIWIENPNLVKNEFLTHFKNRFKRPKKVRPVLIMDFLRQLNSMQQMGMEVEVLNEEIKKAVPDAKMVKDFRPISIIGSLYKIIAKILANRLVMVLGDLVNKVQSAFVADRQILDGPFILNEIFQWCKSKKKHSFIFKIDFEKAYDSVRWDYLDDVLKKFGFGER